MFYYPQSIILAEFRQNQNYGGQIDNILEDNDDEYQDSNEIFEISQTYIQNPLYENNNQQQYQNYNHNNLASNLELIEVESQQSRNYQNNMGGNNQQYQNINQQNEINQQVQFGQQSDIAQSSNLGIIYMIINRWMANLVDPLLLFLFFLSGYLNSKSINGRLSDILKYSNFTLGLCCVISNFINMLRLIKGKREQILLPIPQIPSEEDVSNQNKQEKQQKVFNNIYFTFMIVILIVSLIKDSTYLDNIYQCYLILLFLYERFIMFFIYCFRKNPKIIKKLLLYCVTSWPIYRKDFDENIQYNFDFANQIQTAFAKDPVQSYLKFMIYIYEFILVLQIIAFDCSQPKNQTIYQVYSYFFGGFYYLSIIYIASLNYYVVTSNTRLSHLINKLKNNVFIIVYFSSYLIFILLQIISALTQQKNKEYYILQFEPIIAFYSVCISLRIVLNRVSKRSLQNEIKKHQQNENIIDNIHQLSQFNQQQHQYYRSNIQFDLNQQNHQNIQNNNNNIQLNNQQIQCNQDIFNHNQLSQNVEHENNNNRQEYPLPHFQSMRNQIRQMIAHPDKPLDKNMNLIVNYEGYAITISLSLMLFVYMFADSIDVYEQNSVVGNIYYFLSIYSFMFYFLASKKISLAYDKLKSQSEPLSYYWIIPFQSYINKLGWMLSWILSFNLVYLYFRIDFSNNEFVESEYILMISFALVSFLIFQTIHSIRRILHPNYYENMN